MNEALEIFRKYVKYNFEFEINNPIYEIVPKRKHKRRRIQKKWIKRYGTIKKYVRTEIKIGFDFADISKSLTSHTITLRLRAKFDHPITLEFFRPLFVELEPRAFVVKPKLKTYTFPEIRQNLAMHYDEYRHFCSNKVQQDDLVNSFKQRAEEIALKGVVIWEN